MPRPNWSAYSSASARLSSPHWIASRSTLRDVAEDVVAEVAPRDVDAERQRQPGLEQPPLAEVEHLHEPVVLERELALVDQESGLGATRRDLLRDLVERELAETEVVEHEPQREERRRHRPGHDDLELAQLVERQLLARDHDRPVARPDARSVRQERVVLLHERVRGERDRRHLEPPRARPLVQRLDVAEHLLELVAARVDEVRRQRPVHERVVGVRAVSDADPQGGRTLAPCSRV